MKKNKAHIGIIMGSDSDLEVMSQAAEILEKFSIPCEVTIVSAHRTPDRLVEYCRHAERRGLRLLIAGAGGAAHLPGMAAALTHLPVIGVPINSKNSIDGVDSLLSIVQMPPGVPVATVAINGAFNAGVLAAQLLAGSNSKLLREVKKFKAGLSSKVMDKVKSLQTLGYKKFLSRKNL